jgi:hypothetical protein
MLRWKCSGHSRAHGGGENGPEVLAAVVEPRDDTTVDGMGKFDHIRWAGHIGDASAKAKKEPASEKLGQMMGDLLDNGPRDDEGASNGNAHAPTPGISDRPNEGQGAHGANGVHAHNDARLEPEDGGAELRLEGWHVNRLPIRYYLSRLRPSTRSLWALALRRPPANYWTNHQPHSKISRRGSEDLWAKITTFYF